MGSYVMEAHFVAQMRELNDAKLFRSSFMLGKAVAKSTYEGIDWIYFKYERIRSLCGLGHYDDASSESSTFISWLKDAAAEQNNYPQKVREACPIMEIKLKLIIADCYWKLKQYSAALRQYKDLAFSDHTLESMMNMASCTALVESEHSVARIYAEILNRWPYALEAAYELSKLGGSLETVVANYPTSVAAKNAEHLRGEAKEANFVSSSWLLRLYGSYSSALEAYQGGVSFASDLTRRVSEERQETTPESVASKNGLYLMTPLPKWDGALLSMCAMLELYAGHYHSVHRLLGDRPKVGMEVLGYCLVRRSAHDKLRDLQMEMAQRYPFRWETWYVTSLREWLEKRTVAGAIDLLSKAQISVPTNTLVLVTRAYVCAYRVKDNVLRLMATEDDAGLTIKRSLVEAVKATEMAIRDAWTLSRDPFVTYSLLHIYTLVANWVPDAKIYEIIAEVDALNPLLKRFKTTPAAFIPPANKTNTTNSGANTTAAANEQATANVSTPALPPHAKTNKILSRLLTMKAKLCLTKTGLVPIALETAINAKQINPKNTLAQCVAILAQVQKSGAPTTAALEQLTELLKKAEDVEDQDIIRKEILPFLDKEGDLTGLQEMVAKLVPHNGLDEDIIFWFEYSNVRIRQAEEAEEEEAST